MSTWKVYITIILSHVLCGSETKRERQREAGNKRVRNNWKKYNRAGHPEHT